MATQLPTHLMGPGSVIQVVRADDGSAFISTTLAPTAGNVAIASSLTALIMSASITPKFSSSILIVNANASLGNLGNYAVYLGLFKDSESTSRASHQAMGWGVAGNASVPVPLQYSMVAGATSAISFSLRFGTTSGSTAYVNGNAANSLALLPALTTITITEVAA